jgi:peptidoglycan/LPS O-acetylase OafA/YrhL
MKYRPEVDGLRAVAVLAVVLYHFDVRRISGGYVGVDVFFVISGFLITGNLLREIQDYGRVDFGAFYERRIRRLFPALFVTVAATAIGGMWVLSPSVLRDLGQSAPASIFGVANIYFWLQSGYFDSASLQKPLLHMWSLGVEEQFYLFWPATLLLLSGLGPPRRGAAVAVFFVVSLVLCVYVMRGFSGMPFMTDPLAEGSSIAFYLTPFRVFEFIAGAAVCLFPQPTARWLSETVAGVGLVMIGWAIVAFNHDTAFPSYNALVPSSGAAMVIFGGRNSLAGGLLRLKPIVWIGLISYSVYLVHWPLVTFYRFGRAEALSSIDKVLLSVVTIVIATLMYAFVERPFRSKASRFYLSRRKLFSGAALGVTLSVAFAAATAGGMIWRFPELANVMAPSSGYGGDDCPFPGCDVGSEGTPILVIGDSFGRQLYAGLVAEFPRQRFMFRDQRTCATWSTQWMRHDPGTDPATCLPERRILFDHLGSGLPVILANHWGWSDLIDAEKLATGVVVEEKIDATAATRFAANEVRKMANQFDAPILIVANPPDVTPLGDLERCVFSSPSGVCVTVPLSEIEGRRQFAEEAAALGLDVIDPYDALCDLISCRNYDERGLYFSDPYHLSRLGSQIVVKELHDEFAVFVAAANAVIAN